MKPASKDAESGSAAVVADPVVPHEAFLRLVTSGRVEPLAAMRWMVHAYRYSQLAHAMVELGIADLLAGGPLETSELAERAEVPEERLVRVLRGLVWCGALTVTPAAGSESWQLTPLGRALVSSEEGSLADDALQAGSLLYPAWGELTAGLRCGRAPFELAHGHGFFEQIDSDPAASERFDRVMNRVAALTAKAIAEVIDLSAARCLVDIGGGNGETLARLLARLPTARGVVFDLARSEAAARANLARHESGQRCKFVAGNFFEAIEPGGDVYLLQRILHDWEDTDCVRILVRVARALGPGARILVLEELLETGEPGVGDHAIESDLAMMAVTGGRERSLAQYRVLAREAGLRLIDSRPTPHGVWILEFAA